MPERNISEHEIDWNAMVGIAQKKVTGVVMFLWDVVPRSTNDAAGEKRAASSPNHRTSQLP